LNVAEAFELARFTTKILTDFSKYRVGAIENLRVLRKADVLDSAVLAECLTHSVLISIERDVSNEKGVGWGVLLVAKLSSTSISLLGAIVGTRSGEVDIDSTSIKHGTLLGCKSLGGVGRLSKLNVAKSV
jgi:hypothetical protein